MLTPLRLEFGHTVLQRLQLGLRIAGRLHSLGQLQLQPSQVGLVGLGQRLTACLQPLPPTSQLMRLLLYATLLSGQHLYLLLHLGDNGTLVGGAALGLAQAIFERR